MTDNVSKPTATEPSQAFAPWRSMRAILAHVPGWLPLLIACYLAVKFPLARWTPTDHDDAIIAAATLVLYVLGDALDKPIWKLYESRLESEKSKLVRKKAQESLDIGTGSYRVAKGLAVAADDYIGTRVELLNEGAKFLRSLVLPCLAAGVVAPFLGHPAIGVFSLMSAAILIPTYLRFKASHRMKLYEKAASYPAHPKYEVLDLDESRLVLWDGQLVGSGVRREPTPDFGPTGPNSQPTEGSPQT